MRMMAKLVFLLLIFSGVSAIGDAAKKLPPSTRGKITNVDLSALTVTAQLESGAAPVAFTFNDRSTIEINGRSATVKQIQVGFVVRSIRLSSDTPPIVEDLDLAGK